MITVSDLMDLVYSKKWDEVKKAYEECKDEIPEIHSDLSFMTEEEFQKLKEHKVLQNFVYYDACEDETKNTLANFFSHYYPYIVGWYDESKAEEKPLTSKGKFPKDIIMGF